MVKLFHKTDGNSLIEVAVFLPVLTLMLVGVVDFGILLNQYLRVADSARSGAGAATTLNWTNNLDYVRLVASSSATGIPNYNVTATQYCLCAPGSSPITCAGHSSCGTYGIPNQYVQVTATARLPILFFNSRYAAQYSVKSVAIARTPWTGTN